MKNMKRTLSVITLALVMLAGTIIRPVTAEAGSVIGTTPTQGTLTINKTDTKGNSLEGVEFTAYQIMDLTPGANAGDYAKYSVVNHYSSALGSLTPDELGNYSAAEIEELVNAILPLTKTDTTGKTMTTDSFGTADETLALGYYIVVEAKALDGYIAGKPFFVAIPSTNAAGTAWEYEVMVTPKNQEITLDKNIITGTDENTGDDILASAATAAVGDTIDFVIETTVPEFDAEYFESSNEAIFKLSDTMSAGLDFNDDIVVYTVAGDGTKTPVTATGNYTVEKDSTAAPATFVLTFTQEFLKANGGASIRAEYSAKLNDDAVTGTAGNKNEVELEYSNDPEDLTSSTKKDDDSTVYTFDLRIEKFADEDGTAKGLEGVKFGLYTDAACTDANKLKELSTGSNGLLTFAGLDAGTYYLKEIETNASYQLLANPIKIEIVAQSGSDGKPDGTFKFYIDGEEVTATSGNFISRILETAGTAVIAIENQEGFNLPSTGGMGVTLFLLIGLGGIILLSVMMMRKRNAG